MSAVVVGTRYAFTIGVIDPGVRVNPGKFWVGYENDCTEQLRRVGASSVEASAHGATGITVRYPDVTRA